MQIINLPEFAIEWVKKLEVNIETLLPLEGGINAQVFKCGTHKKSYVLKGYILNEKSLQRFLAEIKFLKYAKNFAKNYIPQLYDFDIHSRSIVMEYIDGVKFGPKNTPSENDIQDALKFYKLLNNENEYQKSSLQLAKDGFLKITDHLSNIDSRIKSLSIDHLPNALKNDAKLKITKLTKKYENIKEKTLLKISDGTLEDEINRELLYASPGDFGFHNAIITKKGIKFFDFEYSGLDDPAKTILDFDFQPRIPILIKSKILLESISKDHKENTKIRYLALEPVMKIKWACIILNILNLEKWLQTKCIQSENISFDFIKNRLNLVETYL